MSTSSNQEVVHEGWLTKSPPSKRIWRARWRRRWFVLRQSGELPGQYFLEYYTDRNCRKLKGTIDLDQCEQVDAGLRYEQRKLKYQYMFDIKTPTRTYYLAAETEQDMNSWVECICQVCSLKVCNNDFLEQYPDIPTTTMPVVVQRPDVEAVEITEESDNPDLTLTGPYIPIFQCISGKPASLPQGSQTLPRYPLQQSSFDYDNSGKMPPQTPVKQIIRKNSHTGSYNASFDSRFYDSPRKHVLGDTKSPETYTNLHIASGSSPTDSDCVFTDEEFLQTSKTLPQVRSSRPSDSSIEPDTTVLTATQRFTKLTVNEKMKSEPPAPPRPPKPLHLLSDSAAHNYLNLENSKPTIAERRAIKNQKSLNTNALDQVNCDDAKRLNKSISVTSDEMYDFPRTHHTTPDSGTKIPKHCYNNAAPVPVGNNSEGHIFRYDISPSALKTEHTRSVSQVFQYDLPAAEDTTDEPASPCSQSSSSTTAMYSNLPSPLLASNQSAVTPPAVNRGLKPHRGLSDSTSIHSLNDIAPNVNRKLKPVLPARASTLDSSQDNCEYGNVRRSELSNPNSRVNHSHSELSENTSISQFSALDSPTNFDILQYLDLDLDVDVRNGSLNNLPQQPSRVADSSRVTVYKTVDFVKTEAFNRTKKSLEAERQQLPGDP